MMHPPAFVELMGYMSRKLRGSTLDMLQTTELLLLIAQCSEVEINLSAQEVNKDKTIEGIRNEPRSNPQRLLRKLSGPKSIDVESK